MDHFSTEQPTMCYSCQERALLSFFSALLYVIRMDNPLITVRETEYNSAQSSVAFSHLETIYCPALASANPGSVSWVCCDLKSCVATTPLLPLVPYVV